MLPTEVTERMTVIEKLPEETENLKLRLKEREEELANSKKVLKEEIFKRWRAEEALRESEEKNKRLLESFEDGYFEVDLAGNLTFFNESLCRMVGYSHQEMMGMNNRQYMSSETSKKVFGTFNEVFRTGKATKAFGWELVRKDGQVRQVETSVSPVYGPEGDKIGFRGIARDVTERWLAEQACQKSEEKYKEIIETIEDGYYEVDLKGNLIFFNNALKRILGYSPEEMMGMNNRQYMSEKTAKTVFETFNEVYRTSKPTKAFDWELITKYGEKRYLETSVSPVRDSSGQVTGFSGIARDVTERRLARKALEESEQKYRTILQSIEDGYYEVDLEGNLIFFNPALCKITGYSPEELHGMNNRDYTEPETAKKMFEIFNRIYRTGEPSRIDNYEVIKKGGTKAVVELSTSLMRSPAGEPIGFRGIARDITERERMKQELKESEEKYRTIIETIDDGYFEVDLRGDMVFFNEGLVKMFGYSPEEMMGMNNRRYQSEETAKKVYQIFNEVFRTGKPAKPFEWELIRKDGEKRYVDTTISLIRNSAGRAIGFRGIGRDRTDVLLTRRALEESEDKYRTILESIEDGYFEVDLKGNFVFSNESMCKILGYPSQELKGMNNRQFMSEETSKKVFQTFNRVYKTGEPTKALGWDLIRNDGEKRYVETSISLMRDPKGEPAGFRGIARDITERKRLEKAKERAINHLSHELGTPLSIIQWMIKRFPDELKKGNMERIQEWIERMNRNLIRLRDLQRKIDDILNERPGQERERILNLVEAAIAFLDELKDEPLKESAEVIRQKIIKRLDSLYKVEEVQKEIIALDAFIRQICEEARMSMRGRPLEIVEKVDKGICVEMDPKVLKKVCEGFLKNAIENTPDEGKIEIELKAEDNLAKIYFHDYGIGITPENQKLILSGFFHTQDTHHYASKKPYLFNAGGAGSDLLRARVLSERFGFSVDFSSTRCRYLPSDKDECPGSISLCSFIKGKEDCLVSGGSTFFLHLPLKRS